MSAEIVSYAHDYIINTVPEEVQAQQMIYRGKLPAMSFTAQELHEFLIDYTVRWENRNGKDSSVQVNANGSETD